MSGKAPPTFVVALEYDGDGAPRVTAKGGGELAERLLALAREHDIPLEEDPELVTLLAKIDIGHEIPPALYLAVAEVIAFAYLISGKVPARPEKRPPAPPPQQEPEAGALIEATPIRPPFGGDEEEFA